MSRDYRELLARRKARTIFLTSNDFLDACAEYFEWCEDTPLLEEELSQYKGGWCRADKEKLRPFSKKGLCIHLGIPESRLAAYKNKDGEGDWAEAVEYVEQIIYTQKFEGAAAGLLNASLITRDLGLAENMQSSVDMRSGDGSMSSPTPVDVSKLSDAALQELMTLMESGNDTDEV